MKTFLKTIFVLSCLSLSACSSENQILFNDQSNLDPTSTNAGDDNNEAETNVNGIQLSLTPSQNGKVNLHLHSEKQLFLTATTKNSIKAQGLMTSVKIPQLDLNEKITWYSNNPGIAKISQRGLLLAKSIGSTTILATAGNATTYWSVTVSPQPQNPVVPLPDNNDNEQDPEDEVNQPDDNDPNNSDNTSFDWTWPFAHDTFLILTEGEQFTLLAADESFPDDWIWSSADESVVRVENNQIIAVAPGITTLVLESPGKIESIEVDVRVRLDSPLDVTERFLGADDEFFPSFTIESGFGHDQFPQILFGPPISSNSVVSFGIEGSLQIKLNDFIIANGPGTDFTIFENPFYVNNNPALGGWLECAQVDVSEDGENWFSYTCNLYDETREHDGCAGKTPVNFGLNEVDYSNTTLSGGDQFDLSDLESAPQKIRYIRIIDLALCGLEPQDNFPGPAAGFDFNGLVIVNGQYE